MDDFCVLGASRGGVMTYPAARQDSRIKRIIGMSAVTDLFDSYESRDDKMKRVLIETVGCTPQENPEEYKKCSAVYWANEIRVPVLLIHSTGDQQVPYRQAEELYTKLNDHTECRLAVNNSRVFQIKSIAIIIIFRVSEEKHGRFRYCKKQIHLVLFIVQITYGILNAR